MSMARFYRIFLVVLCVTVASCYTTDDHDGYRDPHEPRPVRKHSGAEHSSENIKKSSYVDTDRSPPPQKQFASPNNPADSEDTTTHDTSSAGHSQQTLKTAQNAKTIAETLSAADGHVLRSGSISISSNLNSADYCQREASSVQMFIRRILHHLDGKTGTLLFTIGDDERGVLTRLIREVDVQETFNLLADLMGSAEKVPTCIDRPWLQERFSSINAIFQIVCILVGVMFILSMLAGSWIYLGPKKFILYIGLIIFCISVPWTWVHLYKQNLAARMHREMEVAPECNPELLPWYHTAFPSFYEGQCKQYYERMTIDPVWEVKPTHALAVTFVELFWKPLEIMGAPLGQFIDDIFKPLPWYMKPFVAVFGLVFLWFVLVIVTGMRVWTWFFTIEPANTSASQIASLNEAVEHVRAIAEHANNESQARHQEMRSIVERIQNNSTDNAALEEMIPALERMVNQFGHVEWSPPSGVQPTQAYPSTPPSSPSRTEVPCPAYPIDETSTQTSPHRNLATASSKTASADVVAGGDCQVLRKDDNNVFGVMRIDHLVLTVKNIEKTCNFYVKLGMGRMVFQQTRVALRFGLQKINLHQINKTEVKPIADQPVPGSEDICIVCSCNIDTTIAHLKDNDIGIELGPEQRTGAIGPIDSVYVRDPDRNLIELAHYQSFANIETVSSESKNCES